MTLLSTLKYSTTKSAGASAGGVTLSAFTVGQLANSVEEGDDVTFILNGAEPEIDVPYTITGITADDLFYGSLTGNFTVDAEGNGQLTFNLSRTDSDWVDEIMTMTLDGTSVYINVNIADTTPAVVGEVQYTVPGTYSWTCPEGVTSVSAVAVGGGGGSVNGETSYTSPYYYQNWDLTGGGGGGLGYRNNIVVMPGQVYTVVVGKGGYTYATTQGAGGMSYFQGPSIVSGSGGGSGQGINTPYGAQYNGTHSFSGGLGGGYIGQGGGNGGAGGSFVSISKRTHATGGGGAGGYGSTGGAGGTNSGTGGNSAYGGGGGTGVIVVNRTSYSPGSSAAGHGGGVGIFGRSPLEGASGPSGTYFTPDDITYEAAPITGEIYRYGSGRGGVLGNGTSNTYQLAASGAVRIMWGPGRSFPDNAEYREYDGNPTATLAQTINSPTPATDGRFGDSISISGKYALIGARNEGSYKGRAHIFDMTNGQLVHTLGDFTIGGSFPGFGYSSDIEGNYAAVGSYGEPGPAGEYDAGVVRVYDVTSGNLLYTIQNPTQTKANDWFGQSLRISGIYLIVGTWRDGDVGGSESGRAHIFDMSTGNLVSTINNPSSTPTGHKFGWSVAISGNYAIIGAKSADSGKAYIFDITNGTLIKTLDNQTAFGEFGGAVAISGNYLIVGAHGSGDDTGGYSGKVYIYRTTSGDWSDAILLHSISNPNPDGNGLFDFFGISVDISGTYAVASGGGENSPSYRSGKAYIFDVTNGTLIKTLDNPSGGDDQFGGSVAISGNYIGVTAIFEDHGGTNTGAAYIYKLT